MWGAIVAGPRAEVELMSKLIALAVVLAVLVAGGVLGRVVDAQADAASSQQGRPAAMSPRAGASGAGTFPAFLEVNRTYTVRWQPGDNEVYTILEIKNGWVRAKPKNNTAAPDELWLNPQQAITITPAK
jgi:hypothetical protein